MPGRGDECEREAAVAVCTAATQRFFGGPGFRIRYTLMEAYFYVKGSVSDHAQRIFPPSARGFLETREAGRC